jgi:hypothetical protein
MTLPATIRTYARNVVTTLSQRVGVAPRQAAPEDEWAIAL